MSGSLPRASSTSRSASAVEIRARAASRGITQVAGLPEQLPLPGTGEPGNRGTGERGKPADRRGRPSGRRAAAEVFAGCPGGRHAGVLAAFLVAGLVSAPLSSAALFVPSGRRGATAGWWPATRRLVSALAGTAALGAMVFGALVWLGASTRNAVAGTAAVVLASLAWLPATRRWNARGHLCWACSVLLFVAYLVFILQWTFVGQLGPAGTIGGLLLWIFEVFAAVLALAYLWELCDALGTEDWRRRVTSRTPTPTLVGPPPMVSLHVPAHNEPPEMVIQTLTSLLRLDYPRFLGRCAPLFADPQVGFVQAPQDYRDWQHAPYYRRLYYSYRYFFAVSQPSRNERNGA